MAISLFSIHTLGTFCAVAPFRKDNIYLKGFELNSVPTLKCLFKNEKVTSDLKRYEKLPALYKRASHDRNKTATEFVERT